MARAIVIISGIILGILVTNYMFEPRNNVVEKANEVWLQDEVDTSQAADIPL